jgi:hypothetical protein
VGLAGCGGSSGPAASAVSPGPVQTTDPAAANYSYPPAASFGPGSGVTVDTGSAAPAPTAPVVREQVTYACTGHAPDGVDITYGPNGSNLGASSLPFSKTTGYDASAQYYVTTAQLSGSGQVTCTTTVQTDNGDGTAHVVQNSGTASGGYNIASAQVCSSFTGGWEKC